MTFVIQKVTFIKSGLQQGIFHRKRLGKIARKEAMDSG
jgi:hypothetical protein